MVKDGSIAKKAEEYLKVMRAKCLQCSGGSVKEVERCKVEDCPLWGFRSGRGSERKVSKAKGQIGIGELMEDWK